MASNEFLPAYRVLDLTDEKGAYCAKLLGDLGADVVKVEPPAGDAARHSGPFWHDEPHPEKSLHFLYYNTSKRSITLDLEHRDGRAIFKQLVRGADVVVESYPVDYLKRLGLDYEALKALNPRLVMASITPFGQTGPFSHYKGSDLIAMATSGYMQITGNPDEPPVRLGNEQWHFAPSQYAAVGIVAALYYRGAVSGVGQYLDVSMQEAIYTYYLEQIPVTCWRHRGENVTRTGPISQMAVPLGIYPTEDGWSATATLSPAEWESMSRWIYEVTGNEAILNQRYQGGIHHRRAYLEEISAYVIDFTSRMKKTELLHEGQKRNLAFIPAYTVDELIDDPHLLASEFWVELDHPVVGKLKYPAGPYDGPDIPRPSRAAPLLGESNEQIYCGELGFSKDDLLALRSGGII